MKNEQNIYDNDVFFEGYRALRERDDNHNDLVEQPAITRLLPNVAGLSVLDLGCGYGYNCIDFIERGASSVVGVDISQKMLDVAKNESAHEKIRYLKMSMTDVCSLGMKFDFIYSSLAFHYVEDFDSFAKGIYECLNDGGYLLFSQEHPLNTVDGHYIKDENGNVIEFACADYSVQGIRKSFWFVEDFIRYHRTFSGIINPLINAGFVIDALDEPMPSKEAIEKRKSLERYRLKPNFLIVRAKK